MWELVHKEGRAPKNWCFRIVVPEKILENPLDGKEIKPLNPKRNKFWIFIGSTDAEAEAPVLWPPDAESKLTGKDPDAGKDWRQEDGGTTEDEMVRWHRWFKGHKFEQTPGDSEGQGNMACCSPWGHKCQIQLSDRTRTQTCQKTPLVYFSLIYNSSFGQGFEFSKRNRPLDLFAGKSFDSACSLNQGKNRYGSQVSKNTVPWSLLSWNNTVFPRCIFTNCENAEKHVFVSLGTGAW